MRVKKCSSRARVTNLSATGRRTRWYVYFNEYIQEYKILIR
jgi:hypothetical protein